MLFRLILIFLLSLGQQTLAAQSLGDRLNNVFADRGNDEILDPDVAFRFEFDTSRPDLIRTHWEVEKGYYLYRDKFAFKIIQGELASLKGETTGPEGKWKEDPAFGKVEINTGSFDIDLPLARHQQEAGDVLLELRYQGCKDESVCYPPTIKTRTLSLPGFIQSAQAATTLQSNPDAATPAPVSEQDAITARLKEGSFFLNLVAFFGFGLLLSLTPCVFPMIPILSGIIVGQGESITSTRAFSLSLVYVLAMAVTYALLGVIAGSFSFNVQAAFQNAYMIGAFSLIFVLLALSMFGFYELQLPAAIQTRLSAASDQQEAGTLRGAGIMGFLSAILVGPCVAPPLAGALLYISQTGNALFGGLALFAMGLGFGVPLLVIGCSAGSLLPKAGAWMESIKRFFGVIMLAVAIWFLERIWPAFITMTLWSALFIVSAVFLGALDKTEGSGSLKKLSRGLGLLLFVYGVLLVIGASSGGKSLNRPLANLNTGLQSQSAPHLPFKRIKSLSDLESEISQAGKEGKLLMLDFYADWCVVCKEMEEYTFSDADVVNSLNNFVLLQVDVTANDEIDQALLKHFDLFGPPAILFFGADGQERNAFRLVGFVEAERFIRHLGALAET